MMIERRILEALDACRPDSDDLHNAAHAEMAEAAALVREDSAALESLARVRGFDLRIQREMESIELPAGLAERVKARLALAADASSAARPSLVSKDDACSVASVKLAATELEVSPTPRESFAAGVLKRRRWLISAAAVAAALVLGVGVWQFSPREEVEISREQFRALSRDAHALAQDPSANWQTDPSLAPADRPFPDESLLARARGFQLLELPGDRQAVAYDVSHRNRRATVIVYRALAPELDLVPPQTPFNTQRTCIGLWQRNGLLFALVVEGSPANYRQFLRSNQGNLG